VKLCYNPCWYNSLYRVCYRHCEPNYIIVTGCIVVTIANDLKYTEYVLMRSRTRIWSRNERQIV